MMLDLPLFPLDTVLFPGMPLNLHIFEERYKQMINLCIDKRQPFGVVLISSGVAQNGPLAEPHMIGCTAQITQVQPLGQGRMHIVAVGRDRFQIKSLRYDQPYLVGEVELHPLQQDEAGTLKTSSEKLRELVNRYLTILQKAGQVPFDMRQLPRDTMSLAYLASYMLQVSAEQKQSLLAADRASLLLRELNKLYRREVLLLEALLSPPEQGENASPFSLN
ncbi:MAG: LON peptidase substrate-binding domain-containing protein [bacterium]|nr:LON peptidase substrate-binding domain-containing protein [bacterium]